MKKKQFNQLIGNLWLMTSFLVRDNIGMVLALSLGMMSFYFAEREHK